MVFFKEWRESRQFISILGVATAIVLLMLIGVYINIPSESYRAMIYLILIIFWIFCAVIDAYSEKGWIVGTIGLGTSAKNAVFAFIVGGGIMFLLIGSNSFSLGIPLTVISDSSLKLFYIVLAAPFVEEMFFRFTGVYTMTLMFKNSKLPYYDIVAVLFVNTFFGLFHGYAYGWNSSAMVAAFIFGIFVSIGNQYFKSGAFSLGAHFINNLLIFMR